eukprot:COSAG01_NODE_5358_length_4312_cov_76.222882_2_plen_151_part_00
MFANFVLLVQRAVQHLLANDLIHGDIKDDQFFLTAEGSVVLGDFGTAWKLVDEDSVAQRLGGRDELMTRRCEPAGAARVPRLVPCDCAERERRGPFHSSNSPQLSAERGLVAGPAWGTTRRPRSVVAPEQTATHCSARCTPRQKASLLAF